MENDVNNRINELHSAAKKHPLYTQDKVENIVLLRYSKNGFKRPDVLFVGEAPGFDENKEGLPFIGRSGKLLQRWIDESKIESYTIINAVPIIPLTKEGKIRKPTKDEIEYFRPYTKKLILAINPKVIIGLGRSAMEFLEMGYIKAKTCRTKTIDNGIYYKVGFQYHPSYYLRNGNKGIEQSFKDFQELRGVLK